MVAAVLYLFIVGLVNGPWLDDNCFGLWYSLLWLSWQDKAVLQVVAKGFIGRVGVG